MGVSQIDTVKFRGREERVPTQLHDQPQSFGSPEVHPQWQGRRVGDRVDREEVERQTRTCSDSSLVAMERSSLLKALEGHHWPLSRRWHDQIHTFTKPVSILYGRDHIGEELRWKHFMIEVREMMAAWTKEQHWGWREWKRTDKSWRVSLSDGWLNWDWGDSRTWVSWWKVQVARGPEDHKRERMLWVLSVGRGQGSEKGGGDDSFVHTRIWDTVEYTNGIPSSRCMGLKF